MTNPSLTHQQSLFEPSADSGDPIRQSGDRATAFSIRFEEMAVREKRVRLHIECYTLLKTDYI